MFPLHAPTLAFMLTVVTVTTSVLLFISWLQNRDVAALRWWSLANLLCGAALPLLGMRCLS